MNVIKPTYHYIKTCHSAFSHRHENLLKPVILLSLTAAKNLVNLGTEPN